MKILRVTFLTFLTAFSIAAQVPLKTNEFAVTGDAKFSSDGKLIVFDSQVFKSGVNDSVTSVSGGIRVVNADGTGWRVVTPNSPGVVDTQPNLSPDNSKVVFLRRTGTVKNQTLDVFVVNLDGTGLKRITSTKEDEARPAFTADGKEVVYVRVHYSSWDTASRNDAGELVSFDLQSSVEKVLISKEYMVAQALPSPRAGTFTIIATALDATGKPLQSTLDAKNGLAMAIPAAAAARGLPPARPIPGFKVPSGADPTITYVSSAREKSAFLISAGYGAEYYLLSRTGTESIGKLEEANMTISPDGNKLVSGSRNGEHIKVYDIAGKSWTKISAKP